MAPSERAAWLTARRGLAHRRASVESGAAARSRRHHRQDLVGSAVGGVFLPADRTERPLQHAADADRVRPEMKVDRALVQGALGLRRAVTLAQIIQPGRAVVALGP